MNDDTISRQAAIDAIDRAVTKEAARWSLQELPSAERHGRWVETDTYPKCSVCGLYGVSDMNYCPNCGAKME